MSPFRPLPGRRKPRGNLAVNLNNIMKIMRYGASRRPATSPYASRYLLVPQNLFASRAVFFHEGAIRGGRHRHRAASAGRRASGRTDSRSRWIGQGNSRNNKHGIPGRTVRSARAYRGICIRSGNRDASHRTHGRSPVPVMQAARSHVLLAERGAREKPTMSSRRSVRGGHFTQTRQPPGLRAGSAT